MDIEDQNLTKTLTLQLLFDDEESERKVFESTQESRSVYNDTIRLAKQGEDWDDIRRQMEQDANLVTHSWSSRKPSKRWRTTTTTTCPVTQKLGHTPCG